MARSARDPEAPPGIPVVLPWSPSNREQWADAVVHLAGIACALIGLAYLLFTLPRASTLRTVLALALYGAGLLAMLGCSLAYNHARPGPRKEWLRRFDHAAIFIMIAGTYTPIMMLPLTGAWSAALLAAVWAVAIGGAATKLAAPRRFERASTIAYLILGWTALILIGPLTARLSLLDLLLIAAGGLVYSLGVLVHFARRLPYRNAIWHGFVVVAAACHYVVVLRIADMAVA